MKHKTSGNLKSKPAYIKSTPVSGAVPTPTKNMSVNVKKIENGFLVHHSGMKGNKFVEKIHYSPTNPISLGKRKRR